MRVERTVWAYMYIGNPLVAWECYRGMIISPDAINDKKCNPIALRAASLLKDSSKNRRIFETKLELIRQASFPNAISRFRCWYAFENRVDAETASRLWTSKHFNPQFICEIGLLEGSQITKVDSNWITSRFGNNSNESWMNSYWNGEPCPDNSATPLWELLVNGRGVIYGTDLRQKAYDLIAKNQPKILGLLECARIGALHGFDVGQIVPFVQKISDQKYQVVYIMDKRDINNPTFVNIVKNEPQKNIKDLQQYSDFVTLDMRQDFFEFALPDRMEFPLVTYGSPQELYKRYLRMKGA